MRVRGVVQGVGFRPWCVQLAATLKLTGWVRNDAEGVEAEVQGPAGALAAFAAACRACPLPLARVDSVTHQVCEVQASEQDALQIWPSASGHALNTGLPPDSAPCSACVTELFNPTDRRKNHPFINCTHCGPRFSVTRSLPYDRPATSMAGFPMCPDCAAEYAHVSDRRYHAQPVCCPQCGPRLTLVDPTGHPIHSDDDPVRAAVRRLLAGEVLAVKGVGGYHLMADTRHPLALARLRQAKQRMAKPFALMVPNVASARRWVALGPEEARLLESPARPVLLLPCLPGVSQRHALIAPGLDEWGVMLPSSPLHWLLIHQALGAPEDPHWREAEHPLLWVCTSANAAGEPLVHTEAGALTKLPGLADALLWNDRDILNPLDDSVRRPMGVNAQGRLHAPFVRRARGHVPEPVLLPGVPTDAPSMVATGAPLKNTVCVTRGNQAFLSAHGGDLTGDGNHLLHAQAIDRLVQFLGVKPVGVAHDLNSKGFNHVHAQTLAARWRVPTWAVQHPVAHGAAVLAEHGHDRPALALVMDDAGLGWDGEVWGGELLAFGRGGGVTRLAHLPRLPQPMADSRHTACAKDPMEAAAALIAGLHDNPHAGHATMQLETLAARKCNVPPWPDAWALDSQGRLHWQDLRHRLTQPHKDAATSAAAFHATLAQALVAWVAWHATEMETETVALGGACWLNRLLRNAVVTGLQRAGLTVLEARAAPPGDGGLSLGQAAWALLLHAGTSTGPRGTTTVER